MRRGAGYLLGVGFDGTRLPDDVAALAEQSGLGGVVLFTRNCPSLEAVLSLTARARALDDGALLLFFAHPAARGVAYPLTHGQGEAAGACRRAVRVRHGPGVELGLDFPARSSLCVRVGADGSVAGVDLGWRAR